VNTNPAAFAVLCFGDSNTHGERASDFEAGRLPPDLRWTGRLQRLLGDRYAVIEEGLNGRTTDLEYADRPGWNGRAYLLPCLASHQPLDLVVLMLGTNDMKPEFGRTACDIAAALGGLVDDIQRDALNRAGGPPLVLLVSPVPADDTRPLFEQETAPEFDIRSVQVSRQLAPLLRELAEARGVLFADAATVAEVGDDGIHLSIDSHRRLAELLARIIGTAQLGRRPSTPD
jgi:lysophospholipase L1-like esterase